MDSALPVRTAFRWNYLSYDRVFGPGRNDFESPAVRHPHAAFALSHPARPALTGIWVLLAVLSFLQRRVALWGLAIFCTLKSVVHAFLLWIVVRFAHGLSPASQTTLAQRFPHYHETPYWLGLVGVVYGSVAIALWRVLLTRRLAVNVNEMWN